MRRLVAGISVALLCACAASPSLDIAETNGRVVLAESHIGEGYDQVMPRAAASYTVEPNCEQRKVSLQKQRKAFLYETCGFNPKSQRFSNAPLAEVVYHFIDHQLVRVDVRAQGDSALVDSVKKDMAAIFGSTDAIQSTVGTNSYQWNAKQHVAGVRAGAGANAGNVHVRLLDETLSDNAPWLAAE